MTATVLQIRPAAAELVLTRGQQDAYHLLCQAAHAGYRAVPFVVINGYAGTGKTTLLKRLQHLRPLQLAPTGKAALRLTEATGSPSYTIHRALYAVWEDEEGEPHFSRRRVEPPKGCKLIVVDESSMVSERLFDGVLDAGREMHLPVAFIGDRAQLPPVAHRGEEAFSVLKIDTCPRVDMTEVVRQAATNPVLAASLCLRRGEWREGLEGFPRVPEGGLVQAALEVHRRGGMVIVHTNRTRVALNAALRRQQGFPERELQPGEPLLVLKNNYALDRYNGEVVTFVRWAKAPAPIWWAAGNRHLHLGEAVLDGGRALVCQEVLDGQVDARDVRRLAKQLEDGGATGTKDPGAIDHVPFLQAEYGYTLTCHKSQGSEADDVLVVLEPTVPIREREGWQWAYTAITRARRSVTLQVGLGGLPRPVLPRAVQPAQGRLL